VVQVLAIFLACWVILVVLSRVLTDNPRGDVFTGILYHGCRLYCRFFQRASATGVENIPDDKRPGALIVLANHTAGVDPFLVQTFTKFEARWMMGADMMLPSFAPIWEHLRIIPVKRDGKDTSSAREALKHLKDGGVLGVFPEGGLENPPGVLRPFLPGVGLIIARSGAPVLPVFIEGTPVTKSPYGSLFVPGRARLTFGPLMRFDGMSSEEITTKLESWFAQTSGWPKRDERLW